MSQHSSDPHPLGWGNCLKYLKKRGEEQKRGESKQIFNKMGGTSWIKGWVPQKWWLEPRQELWLLHLPYAENNKVNMNILVLKLVVGFREGVLVAQKIYMLFLRYYLRNNLQEIYLRNYLQYMLMNCFCGMVDRYQAFSLISSQDHCQSPHHPKSLTHHQQDLNFTEPQFRLS